MFLARIKYKKGQELKYISHLDLQRCFHRLLKRTGIDISYSQGFNPHPKVSYAMAMPVGMTSEGEYLDVELESSEECIKDRLNQKAPPGLEIKGVKLYTSPQKSLSSLITNSTYLVSLPLKEGIKYEEVVKAIDEILQKKCIEVVKKNKKGKMVSKDIRPLIKELKVSEVKEGLVLLNTRLATGSIENLNPKMLIEYIIKEKELFNERPFPKVHRLEMFVNGNKTPLD